DYFCAAWDDSLSAYIF
nr:immunoglobulin light chain junction region [Macaca mulatta]MOW18803.1 immunoglobulin light chain junction region [Macaca mulatta]